MAEQIDNEVFKEYQEAYSSGSTNMSFENWKRVRATNSEAINYITFGTKQIDNEIREKIVSIFKAAMENCMDCEYYHNEDCVNTDGLCTRSNDLVDSILSLIQPLIEQAKQEVAKEIMDKLGRYSWNTPYISLNEQLAGKEATVYREVKIEEAKWQELKAHYLGNKGEEG